MEKNWHWFCPECNASGSIEEEEGWGPDAAGENTRREFYQKVKLEHFAASPDCSLPMGLLWIASDRDAFENGADDPRIMTSITIETHHIIEESGKRIDAMWERYRGEQKTEGLLYLTAVKDTLKQINTSSVELHLKLLQELDEWTGKSEAADVERLRRRIRRSLSEFTTIVRDAFDYIRRSLAGTGFTDET